MMLSTEGFVSALTKARIKELGMVMGSCHNKSDVVVRA